MKGISMRDEKTEGRGTERGRELVRKEEYLFEPGDPSYVLYLFICGHRYRRNEGTMVKAIVRNKSKPVRPVGKKRSEATSVRVEEIKEGRENSRPQREKGRSQV